MSLYSRIARFAWGLARASIVLALFTCALAVGAIVHLDLPSARRIAARALNAILRPSFVGRVTIESIGGLGVSGARGVVVEVRGVRGTRVLYAGGARVGISPWRVARSFLFDPDEARVDVSVASIDYAEVVLDVGDDGQLQLARAFDAKTPTPPPSARGRGLRLSFPRVALGHVWAHGTLPGAPPIDAELDGLEGTLLVAPQETRIDADRVALSTRALPMGANVGGGLSAHVVVPSRPESDTVMQGVFRGTVGGAPTTALASMAGKRVDAVVEVPEVTAARVRAVMTKAPVYAPVSAHLELHGELPALHTTGRLRAGSGQVDLDAHAILGDDMTATARVKALGVDLRAFTRSAPSSSLGAVADLRAKKTKDGPITGSFQIEVPGGRLADQTIPRSSLRGDLELQAGGHPPVASPPVVRASVHARVQGLTRGKDGIDGADLDVLATGRIDNPALKTLLSAEGVHVAGYRVSQVRVATQGLLDAQEVFFLARGETSYPTLEGRANIETKHGLAVQAASAWVSRGNALVALRLREARMERGEVVIDDAELDGLGPVAHGSLRANRDGFALRARGEGLDLKRLGYILRQEDVLHDGQLDVDVDVDARRDGVRGHAKVKAERVTVASIHGGALDVDVALEGRKVRGAARIAVEDVGFVDLRSHAVEVGGRGPIDAGALRKARGDVVFSGQCNLRKLAAMIPPDRLPVSELSGDLLIEGRVTRDSESDAPPDFALSAYTRGLVVGTKSGPVEHRGKIDIVSPPKSRLYQVDPQINVRVDGASGFAEVATRLVDERGAVVAVDAKVAELPYRELLASLDGARERLAKVPFSMTVVVPRRKLDELPPWVRLPDASGEIDVLATVTGTAETPTVSAVMSGRSLRFVGMTPGSHLDADATLACDGEKGDLGVHLRGKEREVLAASAHVDVNLRGALLGESDPHAWTASATGKLDRFPLAALGPLADRQIGGHVSGTFSIDDLHKDARAKVAVEMGDLEVGSAKYKSGNATVTLDGKGLDASARFDQEAGFAEVKAKMGVLWGDRLAPRVDPEGATDATLRARHFQLAALLPFLQTEISELDGKLEADASFAVVGGAKPTMQGSLSVSDGVLQVNALGEEFHAVRARLSLSPDGVLRLDDTSFSGPSGKLTAKGTAQLNGLSLASAEATVTIDKREAMPISFAGTTLGQVYGDMAVKEQTSADQRVMAVAVEVPKAHVDLPLTSMSSVQDLGRAKHQQVGYFMAPDRFQILPLGPEEASAPPSVGDATAIELKIHVGKDVEIQRGTTLKIFLAGDPSVKIAGKAVVQGQIRVKSGSSLAVQGKKFEIEKGTVTFVGKDPSNPEVSVTAGWTAEDGTRVLADFIGPLKTGKVKLRSEPPRPNNEIVALIMFGTADGSQSTPYASPSQSDATRVGTTAGGFATEGLSKGLDQLTGMEITTGIDTSSSGNPRPEVEAQIAKDISVQLAFVLGTPPPGMNPDTTYASVDWRFKRNWSLDTTFGNLGSTMMDLIWRYRY